MRQRAGSAATRILSDPRRGNPPALILRTVPLFFLLWQFRLMAGDLADTGAFGAFLASSFAAGFLLAGTGLRARIALPVIALLPWIVRSLSSLPRILAADPGGMVFWDSLLLNFDRNFFAAILPVYWAAFSTYFSVRSRRFLRADIAASQVLLLAAFLVSPSANIEAYRWPALLIGLFSLALLLQFAALLLSLPPALKPHLRERVSAGAALLVLVLAAAALIIRPSQERAVDQGGGLLQPNLFQFDFSRILRLESEISMNDDLAFIVRANVDWQQRYLRRFVLSGYNAKQGFYQNPPHDDEEHPSKLPPRRSVLDAAERRNPITIEQEYYLVNFDSSAFIGINQPVEIIPFETWDASSFSSAYGVKSVADVSGPFELNDSVPELSGELPPAGPLFNAGDLGMDAEEFARYTEYTPTPKISALARELVKDIRSYGEMAEILYHWLRYGDYSYSLRPGIAPDGDQLSWFLFESKKGYCSYFAFAFAAMLRSLGIPCRVAVGFFLDTEQGAFNYYPIRSNMAHAWVEVYFPDAGWIDFDPTSTRLAAGEEFDFSPGTPRDVFERLMKEILENRHRLRERFGEDDALGENPLGVFSARTFRFLRRGAAPLFAAALVLAALIVRCGPLAGFFAGRTDRKKTLALWRHSLRRLSLAGIRRRRDEGEDEWAARLDRDSGFALRPLCRDAARARYAREYEGADAARKRYREFSAGYAALVPFWRRLLSWIFPYLALALPPGKSRKDQGGENPGDRKTTPGGKKSLPRILLFLLLLLAPLPGHAEESAEALLEQADSAQKNERWELSIELLSRGAELYPQDYRFSWSLGSLYFSRQLYGLAWEEYRKAEPLIPRDPEMLFRLSRTAGYLNRDAVSAEYLEQVLELQPRNREAVDNLAWMYYKLHRLDDGLDLLHRAVEVLGRERDLCMTMGTIYSNMFMYDEAKSWYLEAIAAAEEAGDKRFAAVAWYNLSILESRYYNYAEAFDCTNASLAAHPGSSGRLARGELYVRRLDFGKTFQDYQSASETDTSPFSRLNLAQAYQIAGRLEESRLYAEDCLKAREHSWMLNYGTDPDRYRRDVHEILYKTFRGLFNAERFRIHPDASSAIKGFFRKWYFRFREARHRFLFKKYSLRAAEAYRAVDNDVDNDSDSAFYGADGLEAQTEYYNAFESYPRRAAAWLRNARRLEAPLIPRSVPSHDLEEGTLKKNRALLYRALDAFDPVWERDMIARCLESLYPLLRGGRHAEERREAAEQLYALNRGALRQNNIALPVDLRIEVRSPPGSPAPEAAGRAGRRAARAIKNILGRMGFRESAAGDGARYLLSVILSGSEARCELYDRGRGIAVLREAVPLPSLSRQNLCSFAAQLEKSAFTMP